MAHENLQRDWEVEGPSDRSFGVVFAIVFVVIACRPLLHGSGPRWWALVIAAVFVLIALVKPTLLALLNRLWLKLRLTLGNVAGPIAVGVLLYFVVTPLGLVMRLTRKDPLRTKLDPDVGTYWLPRRPPGPPPDSLTNQF